MSTFLCFSLTNTEVLTHTVQCYLTVGYCMDTTVEVLSVFVSQVLHETFPQHTFLMNGLIHGVKVR